VEDSCLQRPRKKEASGISVFLLEELGDARLRCAQLRKYVDEAVTLINKSKFRDHFFEVAAHLIHGIPDTLLRMDKALMAAALGASKLDYEEIKDELRPEKVDELEEVLKDIRIRRVKRQSEEKVMKIPEAVEQLERLATAAEETGVVNTELLASLISQLEGSTKTATEGGKVAGVLRELVVGLQKEGKRPSRLDLAFNLRRVLADSLELQSESSIKEAAMKALTTPGELREEMESANRSFKNSAGVAKELAENMQDALKKVPRNTGPLAGMPNNVLRGAENLLRELDDIHGELERMLRKVAVPYSAIRNAEPEAERSRALIEEGEGRREYMAAEQVEEIQKVYGLEATAAEEEKESEDDKQSRFEEGKPADPTENMSPEDAKKWKEEHEKNKDKFKSAEVEDDKQSRFEEGKPADPTKNMNPEDAKKWKGMKEKHKDKFKSASDWKV
jgi:hypothetical protein